MNDTKELICSIQENASIGKDTLAKLIKHCGDATLRNVLAEQFADYHKLIEEAERLTCGDGCQMKKVKRAPIFAGMCLNLAMDSTSTHIAEMVIQGSLMGFIEMKRQLRECSDADAAVRELAERLALTESANLRRMYDFI